MISNEFGLSPNLIMFFKSKVKTFVTISSSDDGHGILAPRFASHIDNSTIVIIKMAKAPAIKAYAVLLLSAFFSLSSSFDSTLGALG